MSLCMRSFPLEKEGKEDWLPKEIEALEGGEKGILSF